MKPYRLTPLAEIEYLEAYLWYESQRVGLGDEFEVAVEALLQQISLRPWMGSPYFDVPGTRKSMLKRFDKYFIIHRELPELIEVLAVFHGSRDPRHLRKR